VQHWCQLQVIVAASAADAKDHACAAESLNKRFKLNTLHLSVKEKAEGLHWCVQAATPQRTPEIPESCEQLRLSLLRLNPKKSPCMHLLVVT
jgi:hypothetical protein